METLKRQRSDQFGLTEDILKELDDYESECSVDEFMYTDDVVDDIEHAFLAVSSDGEEDQDDQTSDDEDQDEEVIMKKVINRKTKRQMVALKKQELAAEELITFHDLQGKISVTYDDLVKLKHDCHEACGGKFGCTRNCRHGTSFICNKFLVLLLGQTAFVFYILYKYKSTIN